MQSKQPDLPVGVSHAELDFEFDLKKIFQSMDSMISKPPSFKKQESIKSHLSAQREKYQSNLSRLKTFEKNILSMGENLQNLTHFTIRGNNLESNFYIKIEISLQRVIGGMHKKMHQFPILIRSRRLEAGKNFEYPQDPEFLTSAIQLPGANINIMKE